MNQPTWTIGADPESDLWIDNPHISAKHCRLSKTPEGYLLRDLGSTNGTFHMGKRIESVDIKPTDQIQLANQIDMPWPATEVAQRVITIGQAPSNDHQIDDPSVSGRHAELIIDATGQFIIRDCGSTNGTWVSDNSVKMALVAPQQSVRIGLVQQSVAEILGESLKANQTDHAFSTPALLALGAIPIFLAIVGLYLIYPSTPAAKPDGNPPIVSDVEVKPASDSKELVAKVDSGKTQAEEPVEVDPTTANVKEPVKRRTNGSFAPTSTPVLEPTKIAGLDNVSKSLHLLLVKIGDGKVDFASAWPAAPNLMVTNASVVQYVFEEGLELTVYNPATKQEYAVERTGLHPMYIQKKRELEGFSRQVRKLESFTTDDV